MRGDGGFGDGREGRKKRGKKRGKRRERKRTRTRKRKRKRKRRAGKGERGKEGEECMGVCVECKFDEHVDLSSVLWCVL